MPNIVLFARRWSFGSDDLFIPALCLFFGHLIWLGLSVVVLLWSYRSSHEVRLLFSVDEYIVGLIILWAGSAGIEASIMCVSVQGTILDTKSRSIMPLLIYIRLGVLIVECGWHVTGAVWLALTLTISNLLISCCVLGLIIVDWVMLFIICCGPSSAGDVRLRTLPVTSVLKSTSVKSNLLVSSRRAVNSGEPELLLTSIKQGINMRQHDTVCCHSKQPEKHTYVDISGLLHCALPNSDLVMSDVTAGLVLLRRFQRLQRMLLVSQSSHAVYQFLSGSAITPNTRFLSLKHQDARHDYHSLVVFASYVVTAHDCRQRMLSSLPQSDSSCACRKQCCHCREDGLHSGTSRGCPCMFACLCRRTGLSRLTLVYASCHLPEDVGAHHFGFFVAVSHASKALVICITGPCCLQDVLEEVCISDIEIIPDVTCSKDWFAHKGLLRPAVDIADSVRRHSLLAHAANKDLERGTNAYRVVTVGHSLAGGVAALVAILLRHEYPSIHCYAYSPPGCLVSSVCQEDTKQFITSVVIGKDCVPRLGSQQIMLLQQQLVKLLELCTCCKWRIVSSLAPCKSQMLDRLLTKPALESLCSTGSVNWPSACTSDRLEMCPPGKIVHVIHSRPKKQTKLCCNESMVYQAIWAPTSDFNEVLISRKMLHDHSPYVVLDALNKLATRVCPAKPSRCNPKQAKANHAMSAARTNASSEIDSSCNASNVSSFPVMHGVATAVEPSPQDVPQDPAVAALKRNFQLDVNWRSHGVEPISTQAPLASPEPLSETSSLASFGSDSFRRQLSGDRRWFGRPATRMDPIKQSPLCRSSPPSTRLIVSSAQSGAVTGLCFPLDELEQSSNPESEQDSTAYSVAQPVSAPVWPPSTCQTVVEVHHHQDSPTQNETSKSISDLVSAQTDDNTSAELLSVDIPPTTVHAASSSVSVDGRETVSGNISVASNCCSHSEISSQCKCNATADITESEKVDGDGHSYHLPEPNITSMTECQCSTLADFDHAGDDTCIVDPEVNRVMVDRL